MSSEAQAAAPGTDAVLSLLAVSKRYHLSEAGQWELKTALLHPIRSLRQGRSRNALWAVRDVTLDVTRGEFFSIVGANGSGKSTLLRLMAGLSRPTKGSVRVAGRISTLLELGSGFHPQVSGRENALVNGLLCGMTRAQVEALLPAIVEFAGLQEFIDQPMRTYSSGMYVRLGFAIAAFMDPEVLLVDEVLAVGDAGFQEKCYDHIASLQAQGVTIVMVTHDLGAVERFSSRAALMERGRIVATGAPAAITARHLERLVETSPEIHRALDEQLEERIAASSEDRRKFEEQLEGNPEFHRLLAEKVAREGGGEATPGGEARS
jgi:lipopolysaccharide transport system ATP-binding protein